LDFTTAELFTLTAFFWFTCVVHCPIHLRFGFDSKKRVLTILSYAKAT